jgi:phosphatidylserine/phosphatidylglycerophosphate/cardiolipin synthase-like enzyme
MVKGDDDKRFRVMVQPESDRNCQYHQKYYLFDDCFMVGSHNLSSISEEGHSECMIELPRYLNKENSPSNTVDITSDKINNVVNRTVPFLSKPEEPGIILRIITYILWFIITKILRL